MCGFNIVESWIRLDLFDEYKKSETKNPLTLGHLPSMTHEEAGHLAKYQTTLLCLKIQRHLNYNLNTAPKGNIQIPNNITRQG